MTRKIVNFAILLPLAGSPSNLARWLMILIMRSINLELD